MLGIAAACSSDDAGGGTDAAAGTAPPDAATTSSTVGVASSSPAVERSAALHEPNDGVFEVSWEELIGAPYFAFDEVRDSDDPFWHVHTNAGADGFFLSLEMFTTGFGTAWEGETGTFAIDCSADGTGICLHFNPDGPLQAGDLGADFAVAGEVDIGQLDEDGYSLTLTDVRFSNGATIPGDTVLSG